MVLASYFRCEVDQNCALLGYYAAGSVMIPYRRFGTTYRTHLQGSRIQEERKQVFLTLEDGSDGMSRNVAKEFQLLAAY